MISFYGDRFDYSPDIFKQESFMTHQYDEIILYLKNEGINSEKGKKTLDNWLDKKQAELNESNDVYSRLKYYVSVAEFYFRLGIYTESMMYVEDAWVLINNEMTEDESDELEILATHLAFLEEQLDQNK